MKSRFILLGLLPAFCFKACSAVANSPYVARNTVWSDETGDFWFQYEGPNCDWAYGSYTHEGSRYAALAKIASVPKRAYLWFESNGSLQGFFNFHTNDAKADSFTLSAGWTNEGDTYPMDPSPLTGLKMTSRALKSEEIDAKYYLMCLWTTSYFSFTSWGAELENKTLTDREDFSDFYDHCLGRIDGSQEVFRFAFLGNKAFAAYDFSSGKDGTKLFGGTYLEKDVDKMELTITESNLSYLPASLECQAKALEEFPSNL